MEAAESEMDFDPVWWTAHPPSLEKCQTVLLLAAWKIPRPYAWKFVEGWIPLTSGDGNKLMGGSAGFVDYVHHAREWNLLTRAFYEYLHAKNIDRRMNLPVRRDFTGLTKTEDSRLKYARLRYEFLCKILESQPTLNRFQLCNFLYCSPYAYMCESVPYNVRMGDAFDYMEIYERELHELYGFNCYWQGQPYFKDPDNLSTLQDGTLLVTEQHDD